MTDQEKAREIFNKCKHCSSGICKECCATALAEAREEGRNALRREIVDMAQNESDAIRMIREEAYADGRKAGLEEGRREKQDFYDASVKDHYREGFQEGLEEAAKMVDKPVSEALVSRIPGYALAIKIRAIAKETKS